jgi:hypothetical protein
MALGRIGQPDDIGGVVASLCSDETDWIIGERIEASGGMYLQVAVLVQKFSFIFPIKTNRKPQIIGKSFLALSDDNYSSDFFCYNAKQL